MQVKYHQISPQTKLEDHWQLTNSEEGFGKQSHYMYINKKERNNKRIQQFIKEIKMTNKRKVLSY